MIFEEKKILLKSGKTAVLKTPCIEDAEMLLNNAKTTSAETDFFSRYPEEWDISVEQEEEWITQIRNSDNALVIACYIDSKAVGICDIRFNGGIKNSAQSNSRHCNSQRILESRYRFGNVQRVN